MEQGNHAEDRTGQAVEHAIELSNELMLNGEVGQVRSVNLFIDVDNFYRENRA